MRTTFEDVVAGLPSIECWVDGHPDGYRATATFGDQCFVAVDEELDWAVAMATAGLEAMLASSRT